MNEHYLSGIGMTSQRTRNRLVQRLQEAGIRNEEVLNVIATTPRHLFVDEALAHRAYEDTALPIGNGQTISQPYTVARMTGLLANGPLEQAGNRYWLVIETQLSPLVRTLYSVERIEPLHNRAVERLQAWLRQCAPCLIDARGWPSMGAMVFLLLRWKRCLNHYWHSSLMVDVWSSRSVAKSRSWC